MSYFTNNVIGNDDSGRGSTNWSTKRNSSERLRHRPHISNTSNSRGEGYVQYYSSLDADILFGGIFIDEVVNISWQVQQNAMPIFGYNSYTFDDIAVGSRLVQGSFTINFTEANYLTRVLQTMTTISRKMYGEDIPATSSFTATDKKIRNTPIWDKGFDIVVGYGERSNRGASEYDQVVMLDCCQLTGCQQQLDYNGEPILETYSFIARDMKFVDAQQYLNSSTTTVVDTDVVTENIYVNAKIDVSGNNSYMTASWTDNGENVVGLYVTMSEIDSTVFNTQVELQKKDNVYYRDFSAEEKKAITTYVSKNNINKLSSTAVYAVSSNGETSSKDATVLFEITT
nr:MAG TPA: tail tube protein [Caudoviricetes sp.]